MENSSFWPALLWESFLLCTEDIYNWDSPELAQLIFSLCENVPGWQVRPQGVQPQKMGGKWAGATHCQGLSLLQACPLKKYSKFSSKAPNFLWELLISELKDTRKHQIIIDRSILSLVTSAAAFWKERLKTVCFKHLLVEFGPFYFFKIRYFTSKNHNLDFFPL